MVGRVLWSLKKRWRRTSLHRNETRKLKKRSAFANERVMVKVWPLHVAQVWRNCRGVECAANVRRRKSRVCSKENPQWRATIPKRRLGIPDVLELSAHVAECHEVIIGT